MYISLGFCFSADKSLWSQDLFLLGGFTCVFLKIYLPFPSGWLSVLHYHSNKSFPLCRKWKRYLHSSDRSSLFFQKHEENTCCMFFKKIFFVLHLWEIMFIQRKCMTRYEVCFTLFLCVCFTLFKNFDLNFDVKCPQDIVLLWSF